MKKRKSRRDRAAADQPDYLNSFLKLPPELRNEVYRFCFQPAPSRDGWYLWQPTPAICSVDRLIRSEALPVFRHLRVFHLDRLPQNVRNRIYDLVLPQCRDLNIQPGGVLSIAQINRLTRRETFPKLFTNKHWVWNCYSTVDLPFNHTNVWSTIDSHIYQTSVPLSLTVDPIHSPRAWRPRSDCRAYLKVPGHVLALITSLTVVCAKGAAARLFAFEVSLSRPSRAREAKRAKDVISVSADPKLPPSILDGGPIHEGARLLRRPSDDGTDMMLEQLKADLTTHRPPNLGGTNSSQTSGFEQRDLYIIWKYVRAYTDARYMDTHMRIYRRLSAAKASGLFEGAVEEFEDRLEEKRTSERRKKELLSGCYKRLEADYLDR